MAKRTGTASPTHLIATAEGAFFLTGNARRTHWKQSGRMLFGHIVSHVVRDPRDGQTLVAGARTGHLGPTVFRSQDTGDTWYEAKRPPAFRKARAGEEKRAVEHVFWLTPGHPSEPLTWYCGTIPDGLFESRDGALTWRPVTGFNDAPERSGWGIGAVPGGPITHSVIVDPRDPGHLYLTVSSGGTFESRDRGKTWHGLNRGIRADFLPDPYPEFGHDPHCMVMAPSDPERLYQQTIAGSTASTDPPRPGRMSANTCRPRSATSASPSRSIPATATRSGYSQWTAPASGRARAPGANRRCTGAATAGADGPAMTVVFPNATDGSWSIDKQWRSMVCLRPGSTRYHERRRLGVFGRRRIVVPDRFPPAAHPGTGGRVSPCASSCPLTSGITRAAAPRPRQPAAT